MLGGSFLISCLRNGLGAALIMSVFLLLDRPRFRMGKTIKYYVAFGVPVVLAFSAWYLAGSAGFIRFAGILTIPVLGLFCIFMSADLLYLSIYKLTLGFYLLSVTVFIGVDSSRLWFHSSFWADIILRLLIETAILFGLVKFVRPRFMKGREFLCQAMDLPSAVTLVVLVMIVSVGAFWPDNHVLSMSRIIRIGILLIMAGIIQWMTFRMYLYRGRDYYSRMEKELLEMNDWLLRRQLEQIRRIKQDSLENEEKQICGNIAINGLLSGYERYAKEKKIQVTMCINMTDDFLACEVDVAAVLASMFENAIRECIHLHAEIPKISLLVTQKKNKVMIQCENTCLKIHRMKLAAAEWREHARKVQKVVGYYNGEVEFSSKNGVFILKVLLNIPA